MNPMKRTLRVLLIDSQNIRGIKSYILAKKSITSQSPAKNIFTNHTLARFTTILKTRLKICKLKNSMLKHIGTMKAHLTKSQ